MAANYLPYIKTVHTLLLIILKTERKVKFTSGVERSETKRVNERQVEWLQLIQQVYINER